MRASHHWCGRRCACHVVCVYRVPIIVDQIRNQLNITGSSVSTRNGAVAVGDDWKRPPIAALLLKLRLLLLIVMILPFIKRQMILGLVESVLQLGDAVAVATSPLFRWGQIRWRNRDFLWLVNVLWMVLYRFLPKVLFPDVVLVQIEFVLLVLVLRGDVTLLGIATVFGTDRSG